METLIQADVNDVTVSLTARISWRLLFITPAAKLSPTVSGELLIVCFMSDSGTLFSDAQVWQLSQALSIDFFISTALKWRFITSSIWCFVGWAVIRPSSTCCYTTKSPSLAIDVTLAITV